MKRPVIIGSAVVLGGLALAIVARLSGGGPPEERRGKGAPAPVEVAAVERGPIEQRRTFSGTLEARSRFVVAAHVGGRVERLLVDLDDALDRGAVVAELDDREEVQGVAESAADLSVARANVADSESALQIARRELERLEALEARGIVSQAELDTARANHLAKETAVKVARAQLQRAGAGLARSRIRSGYTKVIAMWAGGEDQRVVARRHVDEGDTVAAGDPLVTVVNLDPIDAVVHVTERDYGRLERGQRARITTDAYAGRDFPGEIRRVAPVFAESSRQARMEVEIANPEGALKPGMFVRVEVVLGRVEDAVIVPFTALTTRDGKQGVFVVDASGDKVAWRGVEVGIRQGERVQVRGEGVEGRVVTLGQQLVDDGSPIVIPEASGSGDEVVEEP